MGGEDEWGRDGKGNQIYKREGRCREERKSMDGKRGRGVRGLSGKEEV